MTVTSPSYTLTIDGAPLAPRACSITLDSGRAPHVTGQITVPLPGNPVTLAALDPRATTVPRVVLTITDGATSRIFNLHIRRRTINHEAASVALDVASDEGLASDYATLADDQSPLALAASLRAVVNYALGKAITGATLASAPATNVDATPLWSVTNLHTNPEIVSAYGFGAGQGASGVGRVTFGSDGAIGWTAAAGVSNLVCTPTQDTFRATPGRYYVFSMRMLSGTPRVAQAAIQWYGAASTSPMTTNYGTAVTTASGVWKTVSVIAQAPAGAAFAVPFLSTAGNVAGNLHYARRPMFYEGQYLVPDFSGADTADSNYTYAWAATAHGSPSIRTPKRDTASPDAFVWKAGRSALEFLAPILQRHGLRLVCDEQRSWTLRDETYVAPGSLTIRTGVNLTGDPTEVISRDEGIWFDARVTRYRWTDPGGLQQERVDAYALNTPYSRLTVLDVDAPYPGPGRSEYAVRRAQGVGREVAVTTQADWSARAEQPTAIRLEGTPDLAGNTQRVSYDLVATTMTITARTVEVGARSINSLTGTINALTGTINNLGV